MKSARERARELIGWMTTLKAIEGALLESERIGEEREREACAKLVEGQYLYEGDFVASEIRARGANRVPTV